MTKLFLLAIISGLGLAGCGTSPGAAAPLTEEQKAELLTFQKGVCTATCQEMINAAKLADVNERGKALSDAVGSPQLLAHEQVHLAGIALASLPQSQAAVVLMKLAGNPVLTDEGRRYLKVVSDKLLPEDEKRLLETLE